MSMVVRMTLMIKRLSLQQETSTQTYAKYSKLPVEQ